MPRNFTGELRENQEIETENESGDSGKFRKIQENSGKTKLYGVSHSDQVHSSWFSGMGNGEWGMGNGKWAVRLGGFPWYDLHREGASLMGELL